MSKRTASSIPRAARHETIPQDYLLTTQSLTNSDAFQKREKANEDYAIRQREKEKLLELKKKLAEQQAHLKVLENHMYVEAYCLETSPQRKLGAGVPLKLLC